MNEWPLYSIDEMIKSGAILVHKDGNHGANYPRVSEFGDVGLPFLTAKSISDWKVDIKNAPRLAKEKAKTFRFGFVEAGDVLLSHNATVGRVAVVPEIGEPAVIGTSLTQYRVDASKIIPGFLAIYFSSQQFQNELSFVMAQTTRNQVPITAQRRLPVPVPPLYIQQQIAELIFDLIKKIELNRRMNETLEAMVRAIFKDWFVDFGPVRAKAEGRPPYLAPKLWSLFPDALDDEEKPVGWQEKPLRSLGQTAIGGYWGDDRPEGGDAIQFACLRGVDLEHLRSTGHCPEAPIRWGTQSALAKRQVSECDVLIAGSGAGPCGRPLWLSKDVSVLGKRPFTYSNFVKRITCSLPAQACFLDQVLHEMRLSGEIWSYVNGTSVPNLNDQGLLDGKLVVVPSPEVMDAFLEFMKPIQRKLFSPENVAVAAMRDLLLPKLMSGEIRLRDAEKAVEAAA